MWTYHKWKVYWVGGGVCGTPYWTPNTTYWTQSNPGGCSLSCAWGATESNNFYLAMNSPGIGDITSVGTGSNRRCYEYLGTFSNQGLAGAGIVNPTNLAGPYTTCQACLSPVNPIPGCTDSNAYNYNSAANVDDGSCLYCSNELPTYTNAAATPTTVSSGCLLNNDGSISWTPNLHASSNCSQFLASWIDNYPNGQTVWQIGIHPSGVSISTGNILAPGIYKVFIQDCHGCEKAFWLTVPTGSSTAGCMDNGFMPGTYNNNQGGTGSFTPGTAASNYSITAQCDDGTCIYTNPIYGCTDSTALNYNAAATVDDGSCVYNGGPPPGPIDPDDPDILDPCCIVAMAIQWTNKVSIGTVDCSDDIMTDLIISVALYDMVIDTEIIL